MLTFSLPAEATGLTVLGGQRNRWRLAQAPCKDPDAEVHWPVVDLPPAGCAVQAREEAAGVPESAILTGPAGSAELVFDADGRARVEGDLPAGTYTLEVRGAGDGPRGVCVADVVPEGASSL